MLHCEVIYSAVFLVTISCTENQLYPMWRSFCELFRYVVLKLHDM